MKVLTNIQSVQIGGITQAISSFIKFLEEKNLKNVDLIGVDILRSYDYTPVPLYRRETHGRMSIISQEVNCRKIQDVLATSTTLKDIQHEYQHIIAVFERIIREEKPDLIVINGTYFIPWCLYLAAKGLRIPMILHYHGILTKETEHWDSHQHELMKKMEQSFDNSLLYYIFPSNLAKEVVESEVFGHKISQSAIISNPIADHFFDVNVKGTSRNIGVVGRWTNIKNPEFIKKLAKYNKLRNDYFKINLVTDTSAHKGEEKKLSRLLTLHKPMDAAALAKFYGKMGVIICPSFFETYGNVPQEAVAAGTPALISKNMGVSEVFKKVGLQDFIVDFSDSETIFMKLKELSTQRVSDPVRKKLRKTLSGESVNKQLLQVYKTVVS